MSKIKELTNNKELWDAFVDELQRSIINYQRTMEQTEKPSDIYRLQGAAISALRRMMQLRDMMNNGKPIDEDVKELASSISAGAIANVLNKYQCRKAVLKKMKILV